MSHQRKAWVNGSIVPWERATVHVLSHGLSRGSAIFEVFSVHQNPRGPVAFRLDAHLSRLFRSARLLGMELAQSPQEIEAAVKDTVKANELREGFIKIVAYYGMEAFAVLVPTGRLDLSIFAIPADEDLGLDPTRPVSACLTKWRKLHPQTVPVEAKAAANYLNGMLARQEAQRSGFDIGLMLDTHGFLAEGSTESVFLVQNGELITPSLGRVLQSISRKSILETARAFGIKCSERAIGPDEVYQAEELFVCSSGFKVLPIGRIDDREISEAPGPVTRRLSKLMADICAGRDGRFKKWLFPLA